MKIRLLARCRDSYSVAPSSRPKPRRDAGGTATTTADPLTIPTITIRGAMSGTIRVIGIVLAPEQGRSQLLGVSAT